jgi:5-methyltetrahydrofolate--homocysteine methyltransferase
VATAESLGAALVGVNCSLGPSGLVEVVRRMAAVARGPLLVKPNAGLPVLEGGKTVFPARPDDFARDMTAFPPLGVVALGGCCGTTPDHIRRLATAVADTLPSPRTVRRDLILASRTAFVAVGPARPVAIIGERVNPTGRRKLAAELMAGDLRTVREDISRQVRAGATVLDLNAGAAGLDEAAILPVIVALAQKSSGAPVSIDSTNPAALEASLSLVEGRPLVNSVNATPRSLEAILPVAARHGAALVCLAMGEEGIPPDAAGRLRMAERILEAALLHGFDPDDLLVDCLAVAAGSEQHQVAETLSALGSLRPSLGLGSVLGVSNVSYGLPAREELNAVFLAMAVARGLDAAIVNPYSERMMGAVAAAEVLTGRDAGASAWIRRAGSSQPAADVSSAPGDAGDPRDGIGRAVLQGDAELLDELVRAALDAGADPLVLSQERLIPALEEVGDLFEKKLYYLPQVLAAAEAVRAAFTVIREKLGPAVDDGSGKVLLATVEGDIHDLGKNILKALLENHGFLVEDLGTNVPPATVAERASRGDIALVGLSALMTTTLPAMEETIRLLRSSFPGLPVVVGGAVLTPEYAARIGADGYAPDASRGVKLARSILSPGRKS